MQWERPPKEAELGGGGYQFTFIQSVIAGVYCCVIMGFKPCSDSSVKYSELVHEGDLVVDS